MGKLPRAPDRVGRARRRGGFWGFVRGLLVFMVSAVVVVPPLWVLAYRYVPPPMTFLMLERVIEGYGVDHRWRPISRIAPAMTHAAIAAEDAQFCRHHGFDLAAIDKALRHDERRRARLRGGSTISQQTAKNVFLWPGRSWLRKGVEAWFTVLIESFWGKRRIMEVYLNTVEMGPGVYGVEAAARRNFGVTAAELTPGEASRLAAVLPSPLKWSALDPGPYVLRRSGRIDASQGTVRADGLADCVLRTR
ncbi:MAG TPA: monofunctional biosynthetic peptidoglycan transglycosylase [Caulobacteraceae bacterium]|jgi:monofunctional biosynthetic peptidoglycan transglycosylase|nr:monofunctional biosynthetic peptidoglycan transglycosylase [Caulobacteraceae bacterium]